MIQVIAEMFSDHTKDILKPIEYACSGAFNVETQTL